MKFRFRLEKVLELRLWQEKQAELAFAAKSGECQNLQRQIQALLAEKITSQLKRRTGDSLSILLAGEAYGLRLVHQASELQKILVVKLQERDTLQKIFLAAQTKRKVLTKLEEKRRLEFKKAQAKLEFKNQDDLNTSAFVRKMVGRGDTVG